MIARAVEARRRIKKALRPYRRRYRTVTRRARMHPTFLIIGAQRAGTTSLFHYLTRHPHIVGPTSVDPSIWWGKEVHFFDENYWRGIDWYRTFFPLEARRRIARRRGQDLLAGEATPYYMFHPAVPARVAAVLPDVKLVALLRDPIERAYSHYQMMVRTGREKLSFEEALAAEPERLAGVEEELAKERPGVGKQGHRAHHQHRHRAYAGRGLYAEQLERWLEHFPREQLLVLRAEDMLADPAAIYAETLRFLGARPHQLDDFVARNRASYSPIDPALRARLEERFAEPNARLARLLGRDFAWGPPGTEGAGTSDRDRRSAASRSEPVIVQPRERSDAS